ncbi:putative diguanylate cyclase YdaM [Rubripirellula amarantea]|uniref:diguanylate cyclase n=1 Tax=Rubripirellula amarantea TaxID=2527999 RepID=A0A5C5WVA3_9BACT|nr:diguanylate cyclase [Rubripirellula amarantea]TWT54051.1 putative diguanylate cyclase YdaM [Rubripirellula amarantea]
MMENITPLLIGIVLGIILLAVGVLIGMRWARLRSQQSGEILSENDREQMLQLLHQLGSWTNEYSGNVSDYQNELGKLSEAVRASLNPAAGPVAENKVMMLLQQIMNSNGELQDRLEAAERQLDKQTQQIECYLTEARTDGLTGLFNRRAFDKRLDEVFAAYRSGGRSFVLVLVDIDKFKSINDNHGHQAGDQVLQQLASTLRTELSSAIMVARFGGEEFAAILDGPLRVAAEKMNEVRKTIEHHPMAAGNLSLDITVSVGLSEPREDLASSPVIRRADEALYAAKNIGRNRVYYHDGRAPALVGAPEIARS